MSYIAQQKEAVHFSDDEIAEGAKEWNFCLIGYSLGKSHYYKALLSYVKKP